MAYSFQRQKEKEPLQQNTSQKIRYEMSLQQINFYSNRKYLQNTSQHVKSSLFLPRQIFNQYNHKINKLVLWPPSEHVQEFKNQKKDRENNSFVTKMVYLKSGKQVVIGYNRPDRGDINFIDPTRPRVTQFYFKQLPGGLGGIAAYEDGRRIMIADRKGKFTWIDTLVKHLDDIKLKSVSTSIEAVIDISLSPSEVKVACGSKQSSIVIFDTEKQKASKQFRMQKRLHQQSTSVSSIMYHPYKSLLVSGSFNQIVNLWDVHTESLVFSTKFHKDLISKVVFHPNGQTYYSMSKDKNIYQYDIRMRGIINSWSFDEEPKDMQLTQNLMIVGDNAGSVHFFDQEGQKIDQTPSKSSILALAIDPTQSWMVTARKDGNLFDLFKRKS